MTCAKTLALLALATIFGACHVGPQIAEAPSWQRPEGAAIVVVMKPEGARKKIRYSGELIEVREDGLVMAAQLQTNNATRLMLMPWAKMIEVRATELSGIRYSASYQGKRRKKAREELRLVSHFPQELSADLMQTLLVHYGQTTLDIVN